MKLADYQKSNGIPIEENIFLIDNIHFPGEAIPRITPRACWDLAKKNWMLARIVFRLPLIARCEVNMPATKGIVFVGRTDRSVDCYTDLRDFIRKASDEFEIIVMAGKSDAILNESLIGDVPRHIKRIYGNSCDSENLKFAYFPMGRDFRARKIYERVLPSKEKECLLYCNFSISTHRARQQAYEAVKSHKYVEFGHLGSWGAYEMTRENYFKKIAKSKFVLCPRGNAIETFRMWDSMYLGAVPVVVREAVFHKELEDLPILFVDNISELRQLDAETLEEKYIKMLEADYNYDKLYLKYWMNRVREDLNGI